MEPCSCRAHRVRQELLEPRPGWPQGCDCSEEEGLEQIPPVPSKHPWATCKDPVLAGLTQGRGAEHDPSTPPLPLMEEWPGLSERP